MQHFLLLICALQPWLYFIIMPKHLRSAFSEVYFAQLFERMWYFMAEMHGSPKYEAAYLLKLTACQKQQIINIQLPYSSI